MHAFIKNADSYENTKPEKKGEAEQIKQLIRVTVGLSSGMHALI
jgi:hypothetical protein